MLATHGSYGMRDLPPQSELSLLPALWGGGIGQVLTQKLFYDGPADLGPVSQGVAILRPTVRGFLQLVLGLVNLGAGSL